MNRKGFKREQSGFMAVAKKYNFLRNAMQAYKRSRGISPLILNLGTKLRCGQINDPLPFLPSGKNTCTSLMGDWVSPRASLYVFEKRRIS
jgi:hypothetical protein